MKSIECSEFTPEIAQKDIEFCLANANTRKLMDFKGEFFRKNPHFYINGSDNVVLPVSRTVKEGDTVLAVGASGDYMLDSILYGAKEIVNYDINSIQYYVCCLKLWAIQVLDYKEFINFFMNFRNSDDYLNYKIFERIIAPFEGEAAYPFWKRFAKQRRIENVAARQLINELGPMLRMMSPAGTTNQEMVYVICTNVGPNMMPEKFSAMRLVNVPEANKDCLGYLSSEENYYKTREMLKDVKISFVTASIDEIKDKIPEDKKFDVVFLSNIPYYLTTDKIVSSVNEQLLPVLNEDGVISMYHQGMRINWFSQRLENRKFKLQRVVGRDYDKESAHYQFNMIATGQVLDAHAELLASGLDISMEEIPSYGGATGSNVEVDIISNIRRR